MSMDFGRVAGCVALLVVTGCTSTQITNLTPRQAVRSPEGLVAFEARWDSNQRAIREDSFQPYVVIGTDFHPMQRTAFTANRWEVLVAVPTNRPFVNYHYKFDYQVQGFGRRLPNSRSTGTYQLEVLAP